MSTIRIQSPHTAICNGKARVSSQIVFPDKTQDLRFECDAAFADHLSPETCDGFLVAVLLIAMRNGFDVVVDGKVSSKLFYNITQYYMKILELQIHGLKTIAVKASELTTANWKGSGVFTGFSAGVDSFCTLIDHSRGQVPREYEITHFLFNNVGSHGQEEGDRAVFSERLFRLNAIAEKMKVPVIAVDSNLDSLLNMGFQLTHSIRNAAVPLLFQRTCGKFLYSSTYHYGDVHVGKTYDMAYSDAICLPLLSTETTECLSVGGQYTRFKKTERISSYSETFESLDVCTDPLHASRINCSKCWKCLRTELTFEILGVLDHYRDVFELDIYKRFQWLFLCDVLGSKDPLLREIANAMKERKYHVPFSARFVARVFPNALIVFVRAVAIEPNLRKIYWRIRALSIRSIKKYFTL